MKTFKMYVKTVIYNEQDKVLLLNRLEGEKPSWDLPGAPFTEEQSFDETITNNVQKEIGYYVYPGKIIGISDYSHDNKTEVNVIMEGTILNGDLLLSKEYETHTWVKLDRINDYPLAPWLKNYIKNNKNPFMDVENEIEEITNFKQRRHIRIHEDNKSNVNSRKSSEKTNDSAKSSFSILKDTIIRTFHPQEAKVTQTTPKSHQINETNNDEEEQENRVSITDKLNFRFKKDVEKEEKELSEAILNDSEDDIIIEHDESDIIIENNESDIIIEHDESDVVDDDIIIEEEPVEKIATKEESPIKKPISKGKKVFDMNINKEHNMKNGVKKIKRAIRKESKRKEPEIKVIRSDERTPHIRREKESKVSFNSENIKRIGWKERLNQINRTDANNQKKEAPRPKGQRK